MKKENLNQSCGRVFKELKDEEIKNTQKEIVKDFVETLDSISVEFSNLGGFGYKDMIQHDKIDLVDRIYNVVLEYLDKQKQEIVKEIEKRENVLCTLIRKFDYDVDKHRLDELDQIKQTLTQTKR